MSLNKTKIGLPVFDRSFGGIYLGRPVLIIGRRKSGKSLVAAHLVGKTLQSGERVILFTDKRPDEVILDASSMNIDLSAAITSGQFIMISYSTINQGGDGKYTALPFPQALNELREMVNAKHVAYVIFDTIVPWVAVSPVSEMPKHVEHFINALNEMELTTLLLLPEAASASARKLSDNLGELCPIIMGLEARNNNTEYIVKVVKYQGGNKMKLPTEFDLDLVPGVGLAKSLPVPNEQPAMSTTTDLTATLSYTPQPKKRNYKPFVTQGGPADFSAPVPQDAESAQKTDTRSATEDLKTTVSSPGNDSSQSQKQSSQTTSAPQQASKKRYGFAPLVNSQASDFSAVSRQFGGQSESTPKPAPVQQTAPKTDSATNNRYQPTDTKPSSISFKAALEAAAASKKPPVPQPTVSATPVSEKKGISFASAMPFSQHKEGGTGPANASEARASQIHKEASADSATNQPKIKFSNIIR